MLSVSNLTVAFGERTVIQDLSFAVARGENLAIIGPNGAGKSVLLRTLLGLLPHCGFIQWVPISAMPKGLSPLDWLDDFLYLPEVLYALFFVCLIAFGPGRCHSHCTIACFEPPANLPRYL